MEAADGNREFVADLAAERARLSEANLVRFAWRPAAHNAWLGREIPTMLSVAKPNRLGGHATAMATSRFLRQNDGGRRRSIHRFRESLAARRHDAIILCGIYLPFGDCRSCFQRRDPFTKTGLHAVRVGDRQGVLDRKIREDPVDSIAPGESPRPIAR